LKYVVTGLPVPVQPLLELPHDDQLPDVQRTEFLTFDPSQPSTVILAMPQAEPLAYSVFVSPVVVAAARVKPGPPTVHE